MTPLVSLVGLTGEREPLEGWLTRSTQDVIETPTSRPAVIRTITLLCLSNGTRICPLGRTKCQVKLAIEIQSYEAYSANRALGAIASPFDPASAYECS
jgi:hypothetical protein